MNWIDQIQSREQEFIEICRRNGVKVTHQRLTIYRALAASDSHPDAESLHQQVRASLPSISLDTVYRTLHLLEQLGVIKRFGPMDSATRFDANSTSHGHFICVGCGHIDDVFDEALASLNAKYTNDASRRIDAVCLELRGLCQSCLKKTRLPGCNRYRRQ